MALVRHTLHRGTTTGARGVTTPVHLEAPAELRLRQAAGPLALACEPVGHHGADRTEHVQESRILWRAERNGLHRWPLVLHQDADDAGAVPSVEAVFGCQVGEVIEVPERHLVVAEMVAPRMLQRGEHLLTETRIRYAPTSTPSFRMNRASADPVRVVSMCVTFDAHVLPARIRSGFSEQIDVDPVELVDVELADNEVQLIRTDAPPGVHSLSWEWD